MKEIERSRLSCNFM